MVLRLPIRRTLDSSTATTGVTCQFGSHQSMEVELWIYSSMLTHSASTPLIDTAICSAGISRGGFAMPTILAKAAGGATYDGSSGSQHPQKLDQVPRPLLDPHSGDTSE